MSKIVVFASSDDGDGDNKNSLWIMKYLIVICINIQMNDDDPNQNEIKDLTLIFNNCRYINSLVCGMEPLNMYFK